MDDTNIGKVTGLIETGANDVLVVSGDKERLIPYIPQVINYIDLDRKIIKVDWDKEF
jgi:16S rRNA processing protein RimM